jgi:hypothetical protein
MTGTVFPRILAVLAVAIALAFCAGCSTTPAPQAAVPPTTPAVSGTPAAGATTPASGWLLYTSPAYGYSLSYPASCTAREENGGATMTFTSPAEGPSDKYRENLKVVAEDLSAHPMDLDTYVATRMEAKKQGLANYNLIMDSPMRIGALNSRKVAYTGRLGSDLMEWVEIYTIRGLTAYTVTFTAEESHYKNFVEASDQALKSFAFTT